MLSYCNDNKDRVHTLRRWFNKGGVVIAGYEMYRNLVNGTFIRSKKMKEEIKKFLLDPGNRDKNVFLFTLLKMTGVKQ